ncbi:Cilia- and flagella-associated protein [Schistosoma japonicum]|nr:Cilia- and flagella-associated protein [Schistosoma japonicum]
MTSDKLENPRGWEYTATNLLGDKRKTMCKNVLHQRSILGRSNTYCLNLPSPSFTYGMKNVKTSSVSDALHWIDVTHINRNSNDHIYFTRDFVALNCESVRQGVTTCKEMTHFRALHDKLRPKQAKHRSRVEPPKPYLAITHGLQNKSSTPIQEILSYKYQKDWIEAQIRKSAKSEARLIKLQTIPRKINHPDTDAGIRRSCMKKDKEESFWKLKKFEQNAVPRLNTFRSEECRRQAFEKDKSSKISRVGLHGHGIQRTGECG